MRRLVACVAAMLSLAAPGGAQQPPAAPATSPSRVLVARDPYRFPFVTRDKWLAFVAGTSDGGVAVDAYRRPYSDADYRRWATGTATTTERIVYRSGGLAIRGLLIRPRRRGPHPVLIFNHGGVGQWGRIVLLDIMEMNRLAERGYVVLASTFRGEGGSEGKPDMGGGDIDDALALIDVAAGLPDADTTRVGMWGLSRGGLVTYGALAKSRRVAAAVIEGGPTDLVHAARRAEFDRAVYPDVIPDYADDKDGTLTRRSPINWPERLAPNAAILILHGGDDPRVEPSDALRMASAFQRLKRLYRLKIYEGGGHDLIGDLADVRAEMDRWFDRYVRDRIPPPANAAVPLADKT